MLISHTKEKQLPSIATSMAVCPFVSWSVIASFMSFAICKPLRRIHSRFPINTEYVWEADGPLCTDRKQNEQLKKQWTQARDVQGWQCQGALARKTSSSGVLLCSRLAWSHPGHRISLVQVLLSWPNTMQIGRYLRQPHKTFLPQPSVCACLYT